MRRLIVLVGATCTGKSTLEKALNARGVRSVTSYTTRSPRTGEVQGVHYNFLTVAEVEFLEEQGKVIQKVHFGGNYYGSTTLALNRAFEDSELAVIVVEPTGLTQFLDYAERTGDIEVVSVFIDNPLSLLIMRLAERYKADANADPVYYRQRAAGMIFEHQEWPLYTDEWTMYIDGLDNDDPESMTVDEAADAIMVTFGR
jgi:guanylate kinase